MKSFKKFSNEKTKLNTVKGGTSSQHRHQYSTKFDPKLNKVILDYTNWQHIELPQHKLGKGKNRQDILWKVKGLMI